MTWRCAACGELFDEPELRYMRENLDGENGWWEHTEALCPWCGAEDIEEAPEEASA